MNSKSKICINCGKIFFYRNENSKFCSNKCKKEYNHVLYNCDFCGKEIVVERKKIEDLKNGKKKKIYCNKECYLNDTVKRVTCECAYCGKTFERKESEVIKNNVHFCSILCRMNSMKWSDEDVELLKKYYRKIKTSDLQKLLSKDYTIQAIKSEAGRRGLAKERIWSKEEEDVIKNFYETKTIDEIQQMLPGRSIPSIRHKAQQFGVMSYFYNTNIYSEDEINFLKNNYNLMSNTEIGKVLNRTPHGIGQMLTKLGLSREIKKCAYKCLNDFVRNRIQLWAQSVREKFGFRCILTGGKNIVIHHIRSFNLLMEETIEKLNFPIYDTLEEYTDDQLEMFVEKFFEVQESYKEYTCISKEVHLLFHKDYGFGDNNKEQWDEFVERYENGEFD